LFQVIKAVKATRSPETAVDLHLKNRLYSPEYHDQLINILFLHAHSIYTVQSVPGGRSVFWEVMVSAILRKKKNAHTRAFPILNGFRDRDISLYISKIVDKSYYVLFLIPVFIVQVTKLVQFTKCNILVFSKILPSTSMRFATRVRTE
jgi:hypothetical protein